MSEEIKQKAQAFWESWTPPEREDDEPLYVYKARQRNTFAVGFAAQVCEQAIADERARVAEQERQAREDFMRPLPPLAEILAAHKKESND